MQDEEVSEPVNIRAIVTLYKKHGISFFPCFPSTKVTCVAHQEFHERMPNDQEVERWLRTFLNPGFWRKVWQGDSRYSKLRERWISALKDNLEKVGLSLDGHEYQDEVNVAVASKGMVYVDIEDIDVIGLSEDDLKDMGTVVVKTGKPRGYHLWFKKGSMDLSNYKGQNGEIRANNQYVMAPPSRHPSGSQYQFVYGDLSNIREIDDELLEKAKEWIQVKEKTIELEVVDDVMETDQDEHILDAWYRIKEAAYKIVPIKGARSNWVFVLTAIAKKVFKDATTAFNELKTIPVFWSKVSRDGSWEEDQAYNWWVQYEWKSTRVDGSLKVGQLIRWCEKTTGVKLNVDEHMLHGLDDQIKTRVDLSSIGMDGLVEKLIPILDACVYFDDKTPRVRSNYLHLIKVFFESLLHFITISESNELRAYDRGVYRPCEDFLEVALQRAWDQSRIQIAKQLTTHTVNEIIGALKRIQKVRKIECDANPYLINLQNGLYDVNKSQLLPHAPDYVSLIQVDVEYTIDNEVLQYKEWLERLLRERVYTEEEYKTLTEYLGYCFLNDSRFRKALVLVGETLTGKSTYTDIVYSTVGPENVSSLTIQEIEGYQYATGAMYGKLVNIANELPLTSVKTAGNFKKILSGDPVTIKEKYEKSFDAIITTKMIFAANQLPRVHDRTEAFFDRLLLIRFNKRIPNPDPRVRLMIRDLNNKKLRSAMLLLALEGLDRLLQQNGFSYNKTASEIAKLYDRVSDPVGAFVDDCIVPDPSSKVEASLLYARFMAFCKKNQYDVVSQTVFGRTIASKLRERDIEFSKKRVSSGVMYEGIALVENGGFGADGPGGVDGDDIDDDLEGLDEDDDQGVQQPEQKTSLIDVLKPKLQQNKEVVTQDDQAVNRVASTERGFNGSVHENNDLAVVSSNNDDSVSVSRRVESNQNETVTVTFSREELQKYYEVVTAWIKEFQLRYNRPIERELLTQMFFVRLKFTRKQAEAVIDSMLESGLLYEPRTGELDLTFF